MKKGTYVSRSEYQRVCEENKRLREDLKIICTGNPMESIALEMKWVAHFEKENKFNETLTSVCKEYAKSFPIPTNDKTKKKK
jgi:predicted aconitase